jgi:hypothetical protein
MGNIRLAVVGGAQPRGGWHLSAITRLQGFSSGSPAASPHPWSPRMVTTSLMVGRSEPGCSLCPALSFKDLHHPSCGGGGGRRAGVLPPAWVGEPPLSSAFRGEGAHRPSGRADFDNAGPVGSKRRQLQHAWFAGSAGPGAASGATSHRWGGVWPSAHRMGSCCAVRTGDCPRCRTPLGWRSCSWIVLSSLQHDASGRRSVPVRPRDLEWGSVSVGWGDRRSLASSTGRPPTLWL